MITILLPISRRDYLKPVFDCLANLEKPDDTELLIIIDGDKSLEKTVDKRLESIVYPRIQMINYGDQPGEDINSRRFRIAAIHNMAKHNIPENCDYVFTLEDDTIAPAHALTSLLELVKDPDVAYASGIELGRWNTPYLGSWKADDIYNPTKISSLMPVKTDERFIAEQDAGGLYCALVDAHLYKQHYFEPYDKEGRNGLGCDVNFGLYLRQQGYKVLVDFGVQCDHISPDKGSVNLGNTTPRQVVFEKQNNQWHVRTI